MPEFEVVLKCGHSVTVDLRCRTKEKIDKEILWMKENRVCLDCWKEKEKSVIHPVIAKLVDYTNEHHAIVLTGGTFHKKDLIKSLGFKWIMETKAWYKPVEIETAVNEFYEVGSQLGDNTELVEPSPQLAKHAPDLPANLAMWRQMDDAIALD